LENENCSLNLMRSMKNNAKELEEIKERVGRIIE
jgi:hypothetical protein